jgi:hypothetical protein
MALSKAQTTFQKIYYNDIPGFVTRMTAATGTSDGGIIMVGQNYTTIYGGCLFIAKTDSLGNTQWAKHYDSFYNFVLARAVIETQDHGFAITGNFETPVLLDQEAFILRLDDTGGVVFARQYGRVSDEVGYSITETPDKNLIVAGQSSPGGMFLIKTDSMGLLIWSRSYEDTNGNQYYYPRRVILLKDGNIAIGGDVPTGQVQGDFGLMVIDSSGNFLWGKSYGGIYPEGMWTFTNCADGGFLLGGSSKSFTSNHTVNSGLLIKTDSVGNLLWTKHLLYPDIQQVRCVQETHDHNIILTDAAMNLISLDQNGNFLWARRYGNGSLWLASETKSLDGFWLAGSDGYSPTPFGSTYYLVRTDDSGNSLCFTYPFSPSIMDTVVLTHTLTLVGNNGIDTSSYFTVYGSNTGKDSILCYSIINTVQNLPIEHFSVFPNPTTGIVTIKAPLPIELVEISNAFGEKVFSAQPHSRNVTINLQSLPKGIYFYSVKTKHRTERGKIVLQ